MPVNITMPALSPTMEEGNLAKWLVKEGDQVSAGDVIAEIETDKATMEVEAVDEGIVAKIIVDAGTTGVKVNSVIAILAEEDEDVGNIEVDIIDIKQNVGEINLSNTSTSDKSEALQVVNTVATPLAKRVADQNNIDLASIDGTGAKGKITVSDVKGGNNASTGRAIIDNSRERIFSSPLARSLAKEKGIEISSIKGTGPNGRVIADNVRNFKADANAAKTDKSAPTGMSDEQVYSMFEEGSYELLPHDGMRRVIASRLTESAQTIPSYNITMQCALDALLALRSQMNAAAPIVDEKPTYKISINDFIIKAMAMALQQVPMANAAWSKDNRLLHKHSDIGVAVAVPDGLYTPIVRKAELKTLSQISSEVKDLAKRARDKKLQPQEFQGGSTSVSNLGMFGVDNFTSIINPPQASIVSIGAGEKKAIVKDGEIAIATIMTATFAFDHRVIDGALGAELAKSFKDFIEQPGGMLA